MYLCDFAALGWAAEDRPLKCPERCYNLLTAQTLRIVPVGSPPAGKILRFGPFELDLQTQQLRRAGALLRIQPQPLKVLSVLVDHAGQVVTRDQLRRELWGDETFVDFEQGLNYCIRQIRAVLGDEAQTPRWIETIPRRGYRFLAPVDGLPESPPQELQANAVSEKKASRRVWWAVAAISVVMLTAGAYLARSHFAHRFTAKDTIVLAEFANTTGDPAFDDVLREALAIQLEQSPFLKILSDDQVAKTIRLMNRNDQRLTQAVTREVCLRTNSKAMVTGAIASLGSHYLLVVRTIECQTGDTLASAEADAENKDKVLFALQRTGNQLRQNLGESLASVTRFNQPLPEATTSSLEALKAYAQTVATSRPESLVPLRRAVELDPNFALAWAGLGVRYANFGEHALANASFKRAYELRDRVSERERFYIEAHYFGGIGETDKAIQTYLQWAQEYPEDFTPYGNLGYEYANLGEYDKALSATSRAVQLSPDFATFNGNLEGDYLALNRLNDARVLFDQAVARGVDGVVLRANRYYLGFLQHDSAAMLEQVAWAMGKPGDEDWLLSAESDTAAYLGHVSQAHDLSQHAVKSSKSNGSNETAALWQMNEALRLAEFGYPDKAQTAVSQALALASDPDVRILGALALARWCKMRQARELSDALDEEFPLHFTMHAYWLPVIRASLALDQGSPVKALELLQAASRYELGSTEIFQIGTMYPVYLRGLAYLKTGQGQEAAGQFQKILDHPSVIVNFPLGSLAYLQQARAKALLHDQEGARRAYQDFFSPWKDADPDVPILKEAKAEYANLQ